MSLPKSISTLTLLSSAVAGIIGSGWLLSPLVCAKMVGPAAIITWILGGLLMMVVASTFVILTRTLPITGGTVRFFQLSHGHFAGFGFSWIAWLAWVAIAPIEMLAIIQYSTNYIPGLMTTGPTTVLTAEGLCIAVIGVMIITMINLAGMKFYERANYFILTIKLFIPIAATILLLSTNFHANNLTTSAGFMPYGIKSIFAALPLAGVIYSFIGFNPVVQLSAESRTPKQSIPLAIFGAILICMVIYVFVQTAFIAALPASFLSNGFAHIAFVGDKGPFAGLLLLLGFGWFVKALYVDACISPYGTALVQSVATSRITYAMSQNGYFPTFLKRVDQNGTPYLAFIFNTLIGIVFFLPFPSWQHMVGFLVSCLVIGYVVGPMSLMVLSRERDDLFKPYPTILVHGLCVLAFYICNLLIFWSGWFVVSKIMILFVLGYTLLFLTHLKKKTGFFTIPGATKTEPLHFIRGSWILLYLPGMAALSYFGSFGGKNQISFGIDFALMAVFTLGVYGLAWGLTRHIKK